MWVAARASRALFDSTVDLHSTQSISIHHSQSSQSISIYDREIGAKISVSVSISRFLRLEKLLYTPPLSFACDHPLSALHTLRPFKILFKRRHIFSTTYSVHHHGHTL